MVNSNISFSFRTRSGSARGKAGVYFCHCPEDAGLLDHISELILAKQDCAVYFYDYSAGAPDTAVLGPMLNEMRLFVVPVTRRFLTGGSNAFDFEFRYAMEHHIPILPLVQESSLSDLFNQKCGRLQLLDEYACDPTAIPFDEKLEKYLDAVLLSDEMLLRVRSAFDAHIFLSYRKIDRAYAQELMRLIHRNPLCRDIAIWYDEFLTAGEPFDAAIEKALTECDLFALMITPNILKKNANGEDNYVMSREYPEAVRAGKPILPAEGKHTDRRALRTRFAGLPDPVSIAGCSELPDELFHMFADLAVRENNSPEHIFLIGLAFLNGIDVERNVSIALEMIKKAADDGLVEAMDKLSEMYYSGMGVSCDLIEAIRYRKLAAEALEKLAETDDETAKRCVMEFSLLARLYDEADFAGFGQRLFPESRDRMDCGRLLFNLRRDTHHKAIEIADRLYKKDPANAGLLADALHAASVGIGLMYFPYANLLLRAMKLYEELDNTDNKYGERLAAAYYNFGLYLSNSDSKRAEKFLLNARSRIEALYDKDSESFLDLLATCYYGLGDLYKRRGKADAVFFHNKAIALYAAHAKHNTDPQNYNYAGMLMNLAGDFLEKGDLDKAEIHFNTAYELLEDLAKKNPLLFGGDTARCLSRLADIKKRRNDPDRANAFRIKAAELYRTLSENAPTRYGEKYYDECLEGFRLCAASGMYAEAKDWFTKRLEAAELAFGDGDILAGGPNRLKAEQAHSFRDMAECASDYCKNAEAAQMFSKAIKLGKELYVLDVPNSLEAMAHIFLLAGRHYLRIQKGTSSAYLERALYLMEIKGEKEWSAFEYADCLAALARSYSLRGKVWSKKTVHFALRAYEVLRAAAPFTKASECSRAASSMIDEALALCSVKGREKHTKAVEYARAAASIAEGAYKTDELKFGNIYAKSLNCIGWTLYECGNFTEAEGYYNKAINLLEKLHKKDKLYFAGELADSRLFLGILRAATKRSGAEDCILSAVELYRRVILWIPKEYPMRCFACPLRLLLGTIISTVRPDLSEAWVSLIMELKRKKLLKRPSVLFRARSDTRLNGFKRKPEKELKQQS